MIIFIKKIIKQILLFFKIDWWNTIRINLFNLPLKQGKKFPILLFNAKVHIRHKAQIKLEIPNKDCHFGIIKLGCRYIENVITPSGIQIDLRTGTLIFKGSGIIGNGSNIVTRNNGVIEFGKNFGISGNFSITAFKKIIIDNNLSCSWDVSIFDTDFHQTKEIEKELPVTMSKEINIGNNCWLCQKSILLKGSYLPDWSTIGAFSLVNKNFKEAPLYSIYAGNPAKPLTKRIIRLDQQIISQNASWIITKGLNILNPLPCHKKE